MNFYIYTVRDKGFESGSVIEYLSTFVIPRLDPPKHTKKWGIKDSIYC